MVCFHQNDRHMVTLKTIRNVMALSSLGAIIISSSLIVSSCGDDASSDGGGGSALASTQSEQEIQDRNEMARRRLRKARSQSPLKKIEDYRYVAHALWDTPAGPEAWRFLILEMLKAEVVDQAAVVKELEAFNRQLPSSRQLRHSAEVVTGVLEENEGVGTASESPPSKLLLRSREIWTETTDRFLAQDSPPIEYFVWMGLARSRLSSRRLTEADALMKQLFVGDPDMRVEHRFTVLMRRADLHRFNLKQPASALDLYRKASALTPQISLEMDEKWGEWIRRAIRELESVR